MKKFSFLLLLALALLLVALGPTASGQASSQPAQAANASPIRLRQYTFDPLAALPVLPAGKALSGAEMARSNTYLVQFTGPVLNEWKQAAAAAGAILGDYIPEDAFIARIDPAKKAAVAALPFVRWVGIYQPAYKLPASAPGADTRSYRVILAPGVDASTAVSDLKALGIQARSYAAADQHSGGALSAVLSPAQVSLVTRLDGVTWVEPYALQKAFSASTAPHANDIAGTIMNAPQAYANGYDGRSVIVNITDTGLDTGNPATVMADFNGRVAHISSWAVQNVNWGCVPSNVSADDGPADVFDGHGTHVTGSAAGSGALSSGKFKGLAYAATITFQAVEQNTTWASNCLNFTNGYYLTGIPNDVRNLMLEAYAWGARVQNESWGGSNPGEYDIQASNFDDFIHNNPDFTVAAAAGNNGVDVNPKDGFVDTDSLQSPGTAKNVITIGATENLRPPDPNVPLTNFTYYSAFGADYSLPPTSTDYISDNAGHMAAFSSRGPTADGRLKPDVVAPGTNIVSTRSTLAVENGWGLYSGNAHYEYMGGTSMASPLSAGAAALVRDFYIRGELLTDPSAALIKATLINTAIDIPGYGNPLQEAGQPIPNVHEGWGRIDVGAATTANRRDYVDNTTGLATGQTYANTVIYRTINGIGQPLKITLVWSDPAGAASAGKELVNDLNLRVIAPDGTTTYLGNVFSGGWSVTGGSADTLNNVECVYIKNPVAGVYTVQVIGANVPTGPLQPFALVTNGQWFVLRGQVFLPDLSR